jgi:predicted N-acetyltransferase YhbS
MLLELGYPACTAYGDSELYRTFGFVPASHFDLNTSGTIEPDSLLIFELTEGVAEQSCELIDIQQDTVVLRHILN